MSSYYNGFDLCRDLEKAICDYDDVNISEFELIDIIKDLIVIFHKYNDLSINSEVKK